MKIAILLLIFFILIGADKILTLWNMQALSHTNPNYLEAEKNVAAKWLFLKCGLIWGTVIFWIITMITLSIAYYSFSMVFDQYKVLWVIFIVYSAVIGNNLYYLLLNMKVF